MRKSNLVSLLSIMFFVFASLSFNPVALGGEEKRPTEVMTGRKPISEKRVETVEGNIVCLLPDYEKGSVKPVIATEPCDKLPPHQHVIVTREGKIYSIVGSDEKIHELEKDPHRKNVRITGEVEDFGRTKTINIFGVQVPVESR